MCTDFRKVWKIALQCITSIQHALCRDRSSNNYKVKNLCYCPQESCEGNVFTGVCLSTGGSASVHTGIPPPGPDSHTYPPRSRHPPWDEAPGTRHPPEQTHLPQGTDPLGTRHTPALRETAIAADGTHPTGMHSCLT